MINTDTVFKYYLNYFNVKSHLRYLKVVRSRKKEAPSQFDADATACFAYFNLIGSLWHYDSGRYTYLLIKSFHLAGFSIFLKQNYSLLSRLIKYKSLLLKIPFSVAGNLPHSQGWKENNVIFIKKGSVVKKIHICFKEHLLNNSQNTFPMPYLMHPMIYSEGHADGINDLRNKVTSYKIFFAGNTDKKEYSRTALRKKFNKTNRFEAINHVIYNLHKDKFKIIKNKDELFSADVYHNKFLVVRSSDLKISFKHWLPAIASADFFLACSGSRMPMCHNIIEAMAVGSIPLVEYPEYFHPPLQDGHNCIVYNGPEDLVVKIEEILIMKPNEIASLKANAIRYYDTYLQPQKWVNSLLQIPGDQVRLIIDAYLSPSKKEIPTDI